MRMSNDTEMEQIEQNKASNNSSLAEACTSGTLEISRKEENSDEKTANPEKKNVDSKNTVPYYKLFVFADTFDMILMIFGTIGAIVGGLGFPAMTVLFGELINAFGESTGLATVSSVVDHVFTAAIRFVYLGIAVGAGTLVEVSCWMSTGERQARRIRSLYLQTILKQEIGFFDTETSTGEIIGTMSGDTTLVQEAMGEKVGTFIHLISAFLGGFIVAFVRGWKLAILLLAVLPLLMAVAAAMALVITKTSSEGHKAYTKASNIVDQTIGAIRTVASFCGESKASCEYDKFLRPAYKAAARQGLASGLGLGSFFFILFCTYALSLWYGSKLIIDEGYSGGKVINVIFALLAGSIALGQTTPAINAFAAGQSAAYKLFEVFKRKPKVDASDMKGIVLQDIEGDIELKDVHFSYPARPDVQIFCGLSLSIPKGTKTAIVGESGSGKSTVISLIERFYDPQAGEILIDGNDIRQFQLKWIRGKIGLVSQEPVLFATTIKENIAYGKEGATIEEIRAATELANATKFIRKMPQGLDTMVGEHGTHLSGGQKQRIAIARAILKDPRILLLDEATSALDAESERVVQEALDRIMMNRTTVIVAHRLTTVRNADTIAVVQRGSIVEKGSHSQLMSNPLGAFFQLASLQEIHESKDQVVEDPDEVDIRPDDGVSSKGPSFRQSSFRKSLSNGTSRYSSRRLSNDLTRELDTDGNAQEQKTSNIFSWFLRSRKKGDIEDGESSVQKDIAISRLVALNKPELLFLFVGCVAAAAVGLSFPMFGLLFASVITSFFQTAHELRKDVNFYCLMFVVLGISMVLMSPIQTFCFGVAGGKLVQRIRSMTFKRVIYQEIGWFDKEENSSGAIVARLSTDAANVRSIVGDALSIFAQNISTVTSGFIIGFSANWKLTLIVIALLPVVGIQGFLQVKLLQGFAADAKAKYEQASQVANEAVGSIRTIASFCAEEKVLRLYNEKCRAPLKSGSRQALVSGVGMGLSNFMMFSSYALIFWIGSRMIESGDATFNSVFKVFFAITLAAFSLSQSMGLAPDFGKVKNSVNSIFYILDRESKIDASSFSGKTLENLQGDIEFRHVSFRYPTRPDVQIFKDLNIFFPSGKTVALVGESGSGKSTVISLVERFYDPESGNIILDGVEIQNLQIKWLRQQMGLVSQEPVLFDDTIRANIAYGLDGMVAEEQIIAAAQASNAHKFICTLPQGYETRVGERGIQLSGGQKQRIAIARAIMKDPKILLLDEATSALDAESEKLVQDALDRVKLNRTTIVVAHRLSTIKDADVIAVVKNGAIAEKGKHDELLAVRDGSYATLVKLHMASS